MVGNLILIGGSEVKSYDNIIFKKISQLASSNSIISIIPTATNYPDKAYHDYKDIFASFSTNIIHNINVQFKHDCEDNYYLDKIKESNVFFFTGGDQSKLLNLIDTSVHKLLLDKYNNKEALIIGTSAGTNIMGEYVIQDGNVNGYNKGSIKFDKGFNFINNIIFDSHFIERNRFGRLAQSLCLNKVRYGIGISENTAIVIYHNNITKVIGEGTIVYMDNENLESNYNIIEGGDLITIENLKVSFIQPNNKINLIKF